MLAWTLYQYRNIVDVFWGECTENMKGELEPKLATLMEKGRGCTMPISAPLRDGLFELRARVGKVRFRLVYFFQPGQKIVFVDAFRKTTTDRQNDRLDIAKKRKEDILRGMEKCYGYNLPN